MSDLIKKFENATNRVKNLSYVSNNDKLLLYGYYKQSTIGNNNTSQPSIFYRVDIAKWKAWNVCNNMSKEDSMKAYIEKVEMLEKQI